MSLKKNPGKKVNALYHETLREQDLFEVLDKRERWVANFILQKGIIEPLILSNILK